MPRKQHQPDDRTLCQCRIGILVVDLRFAGDGIDRLPEPDHDPANAAAAFADVHPWHRPACVSQMPLTSPPALRLGRPSAANNAAINRNDKAKSASHRQSSRKKQACIAAKTIVCNAIFAGARMTVRGHQGKPHRSMVPCRGARARSKTKGAIASKRILPPGCSAVDFTAEGMPAARLIEREIMRLADQQRELTSFVIAHGPDRRIERDAGIAAAAAVLAGRNAADAADVNLAPVPDHGRGNKFRHGRQARPRAPRSARADRHGPT